MRFQLFFSLLIIGSFFTACTYGPKSEDQESDQTGTEYTSAYICPMHCEGSGSDKPGNCPVCGMEYRKNPNHQQSHEDHDHLHTNYACTMHPEQTGVEGDSCSICGMALEPNTDSQ